MRQLCFSKSVAKEEMCALHSPALLFLLSPYSQQSPAPQQTKNLNSCAIYLRLVLIQIREPSRIGLAVVLAVHHPLRLDLQVVLEVEEQILRGHVAWLRVRGRGWKVWKRRGVSASLLLTLLPRAR